MQYLIKPKLTQKAVNKLSNTQRDDDTHLSGGGVILAHLRHELEVSFLLLECSASLLALLQSLLRRGQLIPQPRVLLTQPPDLRLQLLLL